MSFILDALKRSEQERTTNAHNPAVTIDITDNSLRIRKRFPWTGMLLLLFLLSIAFSFYWFKMNPSSTLTDIKDQPTEHTQNGLRLEPELLPNITDMNSGSIPQEKPKNNSVIIPPPPLATQTKLPSRKPAQPTVQQTQKKVAPTAASVTQAVPTEKPKPKVEETVKTEVTNQAEESIPSLQDIADNEQNKLSAYEINTLFYSDKLGKSFALINMKKYREGDRINGGQDKIEQITPEGIVVNYGAGRVLLRSH